MKLYFVRHGETLWNTMGIFQGIKNSPLTELGKDQTRKLKESLKDIKFTHFYSSPLGRALETINILTEDRPQAKIEIIPEFREINMGEVEGIPRKDFEAMYPVEFHNLWNNGKAYDPSNFDGETLESVYKRAGEGLKKITENHSENDVLIIVSHGVTLESIFANITGTSIETFAERNVPKNTSVTVAEYKNGKFEIILFSDTSHLS